MAKNNMAKAGWAAGTFHRMDPSPGAELRNRTVPLRHKSALHPKGNAEICK